MEHSARKPKTSNPKLPQREQVLVPHEDTEDEEQQAAILPPADAPTARRPQQPQPRVDDDGDDPAFAEIDAKLKTKQAGRDPHLDSYEESAFENKGGGLVRVDFEAGGRFSLPPSVHVGNYQLGHITDISLARPDDTLEVLVHTVQKLVTTPGVQVGQALVEEFLELMIGLKAGYNGNTHIHTWMCAECQFDKQPSKRKLSEMPIDLDSIKMIPIETADEMFRKEYVAPIFDIMTDEQFVEYLQLRHGKQNADKLLTVTRQQEIASIKITDRIQLPDQESGRMYGFRFTRIGDLIEAYKLAYREFAGQIRQLKNSQPDNGADAKYRESFEAEREYNMEKLELERGKKAILYSKALSLCTIDGRQLTVPERLRYFTSMDWKVSEKFAGFHEAVKFGIHDERDITCNLCGHTEKGVLQQRFNPSEFVPDSNSARTSTNRTVPRSAGSLVFFGA